MTDVHKDHLTIDQIKNWPPDPNPDRYALINECNTACATPVRDLTPAQILTLVTQKIALDISVPRAIEILEHDPLVDATFYSGDLLCSCLEQIPIDYWKEDDLSRHRIEIILHDLDGAMKSVNQARVSFDKVYGIRSPQVEAAEVVE